MKNYFNYIHYAKKLCFKDNCFKQLLTLPSAVYSLIVNTRLTLYKMNILKTLKVDAFIISVGNLTTGGTGKTPITAEIANYLTNKGYKVAIVSRGYGGKLSNKQINIISDGVEVFYPAEMAGDEPYWYTQNTKSVIITSKDRVKAANTAIKSFNANVIILDDGFQYIRLDRNLNIAVIDANKQFGNGSVLPKGPLRESLNQLNRADSIICVDKNNINSKQTNSNFNFEPENVHKCTFKVEKIYNILNNERLESSDKTMAFTGIAQPEYFFSCLENKTYNLSIKKAYSDHYLYTLEDIKSIINEAKANNISAIITTEKDAVKIKPLLENIDLDIPFYALKLGLDIDIKSIVDEKLTKYENSCC